jgi:hypothetical protein
MPERKLLHVVNLEESWPSVKECLIQLPMAIATARQLRCIGIKLIHGFSTAENKHTLRRAVREELSKMEKSRSIAAIIPGEDWGIFSVPTRRLLERYPELRRDSDINQSNLGITLAIFTLPKPPET